MITHSRICSNCSTESDKMMKCGGCLVNYYCSINCQKNNWLKDHKFNCKFIKNGVDILKPSITLKDPRVLRALCMIVNSWNYDSPRTLNVGFKNYEDNLVMILDRDLMNLPDVSDQQFDDKIQFIFAYDDDNDENGDSRVISSIGCSLDMLSYKKLEHVGNIAAIFITVDNQVIVRTSDINYVISGGE